jgi:hypothetical protein
MQLLVGILQAFPSLEESPYGNNFLLRVLFERLKGIRLVAECRFFASRRGY